MNISFLDSFDSLGFYLYNPATIFTPVPVHNKTFPLSFFKATIPTGDSASYLVADSAISRPPTFFGRRLGTFLIYIWFIGIGLS